MTKTEFTKEIINLKNKINLSDNKEEITSFLDQVILKSFDFYKSNLSSDFFSDDMKLLSLNSLKTSIALKESDIESYKLEILASIAITLIALSGFGLDEINTISDELA